jgi:hypothetical protein
VKIEALKFPNFFVGANLKILCKLTIKILKISPLFEFFIDIWEKVANAKLYHCTIVPPRRLLGP